MTDGLCELHHGDALDVLRRFPDGCVDSVVTDPPYKLSQEYSSNADPDNLLAVASLLQVAPEMFRVAAPGALCAMFYDTRILPLALHAMKDAGWKYLRALTFYRRWGNAHKLAGWMSTSDFILIFAKPGEPYRFGGDWRHDVYVRDKKEPTPFGHPAQKPLDAMRHLVGNITPVGGTVLDPYMGSGTTGEAALLGGRNFIGIELSQHFHTIASERMASVERQDALQLEGGAA